MLRRLGAFVKTVKSFDCSFLVCYEELNSTNVAMGTVARYGDRKSFVLLRKPACP